MKYVRLLGFMLGVGMLFFSAWTVTVAAIYTLFGVTDILIMSLSGFSALMGVVFGVLAMERGLERYVRD